jgi:hypothetical protein
MRRTGQLLAGYEFLALLAVHNNKAPMYGSAEGYVMVLKAYNRVSRCYMVSFPLLQYLPQQRASSRIFQTIPPTWAQFQ